MKEEYLLQTKKILSKFLDPKINQAYLIGSRATGKSLKYSDIDIAIDGPRLKSSTYFDLLNEFEESNIPYLVDLVQLCDVSENFKLVTTKRIPLN